MIISVCKGDQAAVGVRERDYKLKKESGKKAAIVFSARKDSALSFNWLKRQRNGTDSSIVPHSGTSYEAVIKR